MKTGKMISPLEEEQQQLIIAYKKLAFESKEKEKRVKELIDINEELKKAKEKTKRANQLYAFISQVNQNVVHVKDEDLLFRNSCRIALKFGKFKMAWIGLFDHYRKTITLVEQYGMTASEIKPFIDAPFFPKGPEAHLILTGKYFLCNNVENDLKLKRLKAFASKYKIRSFMVLPIIKANSIVGSFNLYSTQEHFFDKQEINLLEEVAGDISFAITHFEKERIQKSTEKLIIEREKRFRALIEKSSDIKILSTAEGTILYGSPSITKILGYTSAEFMQAPIFNVIHPADLEEFQRKRNDILTTPRKSFYFQVRLRHKRGMWIWCEGNFTNMLREEGVNALVTNLTDISEKKISEESLINSQRQIRNFANHLSNMREEERAHLAREIHDELGQQLVGIKIGLSSFRRKDKDNDGRITEMIETIDETIQSIRKIATELRPIILDTLGLIPSIEWLVKEFERKTKIKCHLKLKETEQKFEKGISTCFFRICQEALTNISKHAEASKVNIEIIQNKKELELIIVDNGKGIVTEKLENPLSMGLLGMRERAVNIGAKLQIIGLKNKGTTISLKATL
jgi:PAS domain S-box-containing protein